MAHDLNTPIPHDPDPESSRSSNNNSNNSHMTYHHHQQSDGRPTPTDTDKRRESVEDLAPRYDCQTCPRTFKTASAAARHMSALDHWPRECSFCDAARPSARRLRDHEHKQHHYCAECNQRFRDESSIINHLMSNPHRESFLLQCLYCGGKFEAPGSVIKHQNEGSCPHNTPRSGRFIC
ncbi:hypothetical protein Hte_007626 [Hypoxylon texense]